MSGGWGAIRDGLNEEKPSSFSMDVYDRNHASRNRVHDCVRWTMNLDQDNFRRRWNGVMSSRRDGVGRLIDACITVLPRATALWDIGATDTVSGESSRTLITLYKRSPWSNARKRKTCCRVRTPFGHRRRRCSSESRERFQDGSSTAASVGPHAHVDGGALRSTPKA